jgi:hypothetical protein
LFINFTTGILFLNIFIDADIRLFKFKEDSSFVLLIIFFLEIFALNLLRNLKKITIEKDKIIFQNILFPFIKKERLFSYYDFSKFIEERTKLGAYEALWLFKNGKLEDQISSFYHSNYTKLNSEIKIQNKGFLEITIFKSLFLKFGGRLNEKS